MILYYHFGQYGQDDFDYEPNEHDLDVAIENIRSHDLSIHDDDDDLEEMYRDELTDFFREEAKEAYRDNCEYKRNPDAYFGVNRRD